jgi:hypothetical protein
MLKEIDNGDIHLEGEKRVRIILQGVSDAGEAD